MRTIYLAFLLTLCSLSGFAQGSGTQQALDRYRKLYREGKISGDAYMAMLYTSTALSVAERDGKFKADKLAAEQKRKEYISDEELIRSWSLLLSNSLNDDKDDFARATKNVLLSTGVTPQAAETINSDITRLGNAWDANTALFTDAAAISDGLSILALRSSNMSDADLLAYSGGAALLSSATGTDFISPELVVASAAAITTKIDEASEARGIRRAKEAFFTNNVFHVSDYSTTRNKQTYPDMELNAGNWQKYFRHFSSTNTATSAFKQFLIGVKSEAVDGKVKISWGEAGRQGASDSRRSAPDEVYNFQHIFNSELKFDFSKDFEFRMKMSSPEKSDGLFVRMNIADYYTLHCSPLFGYGFGGISKAKPSHYNADINRITVPIRMPLWVRFSDVPKNQKELVIRKQGGKIITYFVNENDKQTEMDIDVYPNSSGLKMGIEAIKGNDPGYFFIDEINLKYL